jgi:hypothetical protein
MSQHATGGDHHDPPNLKLDSFTVHCYRSGSYAIWLKKLCGVGETCDHMMSGEHESPEYLLEKEGNPSPWDGETSLG